MATSALLLPVEVLAKNEDFAGMSWSDFQMKIKKLADAGVTSKLTSKVIAKRGLQFLQQLDIGSTDFNHALENPNESRNFMFINR